MPQTIFDLFPNELLYEVFQYLTTYEILYGFQGLNKRIDKLLRTCAKYNLNFKSWPKSKFDFVCQSINPEQVRSLILSDADDTCQQIHLFFRLVPVQRLVNLESLILIETNEQELKLAHGLIPKIIVPPLKYLSIGICSMSQLKEISFSTPILTKLNVQLIADTTPADDTLLLSSEVRQLKIELAKKSNMKYDDIQLLFEWMPKLEKFTFIAAKGLPFIEGDQWEHLIQRCLPKLKEFHFKIHPHFLHTNVEQLLRTFQTEFWLKEKQWFIYCDHHFHLNFRHFGLQHVHLYTLPYRDKQFCLSLLTEATTKGCKDKYSSIKNLFFAINSRYNTELNQHYYFPNLDSLTICNLHKLIPIDNLIDLSQVKHLTVTRNNDINSEEFFSYTLVHSTKLESLTLPWCTLVQITKHFTDHQVCSLLKNKSKIYIY
ncbi:unnamed protein product [Rotaria socialis]|uniref:F-box domain-containing protein n=1 Tax=Rotaria socialis TaxID=392032 RepID=A0A820X021_9BILA|nr:unnamed protein product [Rotaria socialis]CAF3395644.1 unnamed protein product [Rotaria socialis]CAF3625597.1 unnamed protein product [Rotaria socialis]CAF4522683.1 unnamed protein product [Rotaria socialis]CAF4735771.1 unnamed protein product [Rotaria socialis]